MLVLTRTIAMVAIPLTIACDATSDSETEPAELTGDLIFTDVNNYSYTAELTLENVELTSGQDATILWGDITTDIQGRPIDDPSTIEEVSLVAFNMTQEEVGAAVATNDLKQSDVLDYRLFENTDGATSCMLSDFSILGNPFQPEIEWVEKDRTWIVTLWKESQFGRVDILSSSFVTPLDDATGDSVNITDSSANLAFDPDLTTSTPLQTKAGLDAYTLDWSGLVLDSTGHDFDQLLGDRLLLGRVDATSTQEIEDIFLRLLEEADELYLLDVYGKTDIDLMLAESLDGQKFAGFTTEGLWVLGVECTECTSPAPLFLTVVEVVE